jgi:hypothetical protein
VVPDGRHAQSLKSSAVSFGRTAASTLFSRNAFSYSSGQGPAATPRFHDGPLTRKMMVGTHMDALEGDDVQGDADLQEKALLGLRGAIDQHVAKKLSREAARQLMAHVKDNLFYFTCLNPRLIRLLNITRPRSSAP